MEERGKYKLQVLERKWGRSSLKRGLQKGAVGGEKGRSPIARPGAGLGLAGQEPEAAGLGPV